MYCVCTVDVSVVLASLNDGAKLSGYCKISK